MPPSDGGRGPSAAQHRRMHVLWRIAGVTSRADRLALTAALVRRPLVTSNDLTDHEAWSLITYMTELDKQGRLRDTAQSWLAAHGKGDDMTDGVRVGQVWADTDKRARGRTVRVDSVDARFAYCTVLTPATGASRTGQQTTIARERMKPTSTGYRLVSENGEGQ